VNPFAAMRIKVPKGAAEDHDIAQFTKKERDRIIQTFPQDE